MNRKEQLSYWRTLTKESLANEKYAAREILRYFRVTYDKLINLIDNYGIEEAITRLDSANDRDDLLVIYALIYSTIGRKAYLASQTRLNNELDNNVVDGFGLALFVKKIQELTNSVETVKRIDSVLNTSKEKLTKILEEVKKQGLTVAKAKRFIRKNFLGNDYAKNRSKLIAHVESSYIEGMAAEDSAIYVARQLNIVLEKSWIHVQDEKTRPAHRAVSTEYIPVENTFLVGGYRAKMPHDPSLPLNLLIGCRCRLHIRKKDGGFI